MTIDPHCRIGRIRFKRHHDRLPRKDKRSIERAFRNMTKRLKAELGLIGAAQTEGMGR